MEPCKRLILRRGAWIILSGWSVSTSGPLFAAGNPFEPYLQEKKVYERLISECSGKAKDVLDNNSKSLESVFPKDRWSQCGKDVHELAQKLSAEAAKLSAQLQPVLNDSIRFGGQRPSKASLVQGVYDYESIPIDGLMYTFPNQRIFMTDSRLLPSFKGNCFKLHKKHIPAMYQLT